MKLYSGRDVSWRGRGYLEIEFIEWWESWWMQKACPDPHFHRRPRRFRQAMSAFTQAHELHHYGLQRALLERGMF